MPYMGGLSKPSTMSPHHLSLSPKLMGPSIASIPFWVSHSLAVSKSKLAAAWSLIQSKNPTPPVLKSVPLLIYFELVKAAIRPTNSPLSDSSIHLLASPYLKFLFLSGSKTSLTSLLRGLI